MSSNYKSLNALWTSVTDEGWKKALDNYHKLIEDRDLDIRWIESYIRSVRADDIRQLSGVEFYFFLYDKYLFWRYAAQLSHHIGQQPRCIDWKDGSSG